jgi:hypothetical protein
MLLPAELIDQILLNLSNIKFTYDIADVLGREFVSDLALLKWKGVDYICGQGLLHILEKYRTYIKELCWSNWSMDSASENGHVHILQWWRKLWLKNEMVQEKYGSSFFIRTY